MNRKVVAAVAWVVLVVGTVAPACAQIYGFDPANPPDKSVNVYFGSTKDVDGNPLSGVTVKLDVDLTTFVMVTDDAGRFRIGIPREVPMSRVKFSCSRPGYVLYRAIKRPPPNRSQSPVQADCVLRRSAGATD